MLYKKILTFCAVFVLFTGSVFSYDTYKEASDAARAHLKEKDNAKALMAYQDALIKATKPGEKYSVLTALGQIQADEKKYKESADFHVQASKLDGITPKQKFSALNSAGRAKLNEKDYDNAFLYYQESLNISDGFTPLQAWTANQQIGKIYVFQKNYMGAQKQYEKMLGGAIDETIKPDAISGIYNELISVYTNLNDYSLAETAAKKGLAISGISLPRRYQLTYALANILNNQNKGAEAIKLCVESAPIFTVPSQKTALLNLAGMISEKAKDTPNALAYFKQAWEVENLTVAQKTTAGFRYAASVATSGNKALAISILDDMGKLELNDAQKKRLESTREKYSK